MKQPEIEIEITRVEMKAKAPQGGDFPLKPLRHYINSLVSRPKPFPDLNEGIDEKTWRSTAALDGRVTLTRIADGVEVVVHLSDR